MQQGPSRSHLGWQVWIALGIFAAYAFLILFHTRPPSLTDFAEWTYEGVLLRDHLSGGVDLAHVLKHYPVPNSATTLGIGLLSLMLPWAAASKLWLCAYLALAFFAVRTLLRERPGSDWLWLLVPGTLFFNVNFWYGFLNFQIGLCWVLLTIALVLRKERREWMFGVLLMLAFFTHMIPFAFTATVFLVYLLRAKRYRLLWQMAPAAMACAGYLYGRFVVEHNADANAGMVSSVRTYSAAFWADKVNSLLKSTGFVNPSVTDGSVTMHLFGRWCFFVLWIANLTLCALLIWIIVSQARRALRQNLPECAVWIAVLLFTPVYLLLPGAALGVSDPGARVLQVILAASLLLASGVSRPVRMAASAAAGLLALAGLIEFSIVAYQMVPEAHSHLPWQIVTLAHVPNHDRDAYYRALAAGNKRLSIYPTGMFLNTPAASGEGGY